MGIAAEEFCPATLNNALLTPKAEMVSANSVFKDAFEGIVFFYSKNATVQGENVPKKRFFYYYLHQDSPLFHSTSKAQEVFCRMRQCKIF